MTEVSLVVILSILAIALLSAITKQNVLNFLKRSKDDREVVSGATMLPPDLIMSQFNDRKSIYQHKIYVNQLYKGDDMCGLSISRPDGDGPGLCLYGKGRNDKDTKYAYSVSKNALMLGWDEEAGVFYGQVTADSSKHHSKVFLEKDGAWKQIRYRQTFDIKNGTTIRIENQVLQFQTSRAPACFGSKTVKSDEYRDETRTVLFSENTAREFPRIGKRIA